MYVFMCIVLGFLFVLMVASDPIFAAFVTLVMAVLPLILWWAGSRYHEFRWLQGIAFVMPLAIMLVLYASLWSTASGGNFGAGVISSLQHDANEWSYWAFPFFLSGPVYLIMMRSWLERDTSRSHRR